VPNPGAGGHRHPERRLHGSSYGVRPGQHEFLRDETPDEASRCGKLLRGQWTKNLCSVRHPALVQVPEEQLPAGTIYRVVARRRRGERVGVTSCQVGALGQGVGAGAEGFPSAVTFDPETHTPERLRQNDGETLHADFGEADSVVAAVVGTDPQSQFYVPGAVQTSQVIEELDDLFDDCNGSLGRRPDKPRRRNFSATSKHLRRWRAWQRKLRAVKLHVWKRATRKTVITRPPFVDNSVLTLKSLEGLCTYLQDVHKYRIVNVRQLNQDPLENFNGTVRALCGSNDNPTVSAYEQALKTAVISTLTGGRHRGNCEEYDGEIMRGLREFFDRLYGVDSAEDLLQSNTSTDIPAQVRILLKEK